TELEVRKNLQFIGEKVMWERLSILFNASLIYNRVTLGEKAVGQQPNRPMTGQSPYIVSSGSYYHDTEHNVQMVALYDVIGKRIFSVGTFGTPDIYEMPRNRLDLTITKGFGEHLKVNFGIQDILNQAVLLRQDANEDGKITSLDEDVVKFRPGVYY